MAAPGLLVIGASQWKYADERPDLFGGFEVSIISKSGMGVHEVTEPMLYATSFFNDVVLHLGTNNIICGQSPEEVVGHYEALINRIREGNPYVRIYISSVLLRGPNRWRSYSEWECNRVKRLNIKISKLNQLLAAFAFRHNMYFMEHWKKFEMAAVDPFYKLLSKDGLHLSPQGLKCLLGNVIDFFRKVHHPKAVPNLSEPHKQVSFTRKVVSSPVSCKSPILSTPMPAISSYATKAASSSSRKTMVSGFVNKTPSFCSPMLSSSLPNSVQSVTSHSKHPSTSFNLRNSKSHVNIPPSRNISSSRLHQRSLSSHSPSKEHLISQKFSCTQYNIPVSNRWSTFETSDDPSATSNFSEFQRSYHVCTEIHPTNFSKTAKKCKKPLSKRMICKPPSQLKASTSSNSCLSATKSNEKVIGNYQVMPRHSKALKTAMKLSPQLSSTNHSPNSSLKNVHPCPEALADSKILSSSIRLSNQYHITNGGSAEEGIAQTSIYPRQCECCHKIYQSKSTFYKHKRTCGRIDDCIVYPRVCSMCQVSYANKCTFSRHKRTCQPSAAKSISCPHSSCKLQFQTHSVMVQHLRTDHKEEISLQNFTFNDMSEFLVWKKDQCERNNLCYVKHSGARGNGDCTTEYYICKFDNHHKNDIVANKTSRKRKYGLMPNTNCSSRMTVKEKGSKVYVKYISAHNHGLEFKNVLFYRWDKVTKTHINSLLEQGVPAHTIQESLQPSNSDFKDEMPVKEHFISTSQINKMRYELNSKKRLHKDDAVAVHLIVHSMTEECKDSIVIYKPLGQPVEIGNDGLNHVMHSSDLFVLGIQNKQQKSEMVAGCNRILCIDSTHDTNQYKFHLLNFIIPDEYGVGYPVAHFITNHLDEQTLVCMLTSLMARYPDLDVNAVMTDGDEALGNAVVSVFGPKVRHLLCSWHVKRNWQRNLHRKIKYDDELVTEVYEILETLIDEKDERSFKSLLEAFINKYSSIASDFVEYFKKTYCSKVEKWAMCFRNFPHARTDTNMFVETFHNKLKTHYLNRKVNRRLDDLVNVLLRIQKSLHLNLTFKRMTEEPPLGFDQQSKGRHWKGMKLSDEDVEEVDNGKWNIRAQSNPSVTYSISCISRFCNIPHLCFIKCSEISCFDLCCHMYICSCSDKHSLCKHIHKVHSLTVRNQLPPNPSNMTSPVTTHYKSIHPFTSNEGVATDEKLVHRFISLSNKLKALGVKEETSILLPYLCNSLKLLIDKCDSLLIQNVICPDSLEHEVIPPNSKLNLQYKLYQTVKEREVTSHSFKKPSITRRSDIRSTLLGLKDSGCFTNPITDESSLQNRLFSIGPFSINMIHLKSLDYCIPEAEVNQLQAVSKDFRKGWLYDTIIGAFLYKICAIDKECSCIDPAISQFITGSMPIEKLKVIFDKLNFKGHSRFIIPINMTNSHWVLLFADCNEKKIHFYDPETLEVSSSHTYITNRWIDFLNVKRDDYSSNWSVCFPEHTTQNDSHSCGVHISWYAERILLGESLTIPFNPSEYRKYMYDVLTQHTLL